MALEINEAIKAMRAEFDSGNEDENNWKRRNDLCRRLAAVCDNRQHDPPRDLVDHLKPLFQPILTTCTTERTTLGISTLACLSSIFKLLGPQMAFQVDHMVPTLISLCGVTKKLTSKSAGAAMDTICVSIGYNSRFVSHVCDAFKEKAASTRLFATGWLTTILTLYGKQLDAVRDFPKIARALVDGLQDSQNTVREAVRPTYWQYARMPGSDASAIMDKLAKDKATALKNHKDNPDRSAEAGKPARPASALAQIKARTKATLKTSSTPKPANDNPEPGKSTDHNTSISGAVARKPLNISSMAAAPARIPGMSRSATAPHGIGRRDITQSTQSTEYATGPMEGVSAPDGIYVPLPSSPREPNDGFPDAEARAHHERAVAAKKKVRYGPEYGDRPDLSTSEKARNEEALLKHLASKNPEKAAVVERKIKEESVKSKHIDNDSLRNLMSAPVRRPRIVATPINQSQPPVRPSSKEESKKALQTGRQTPTDDLITRGHKKSASSRSGRQTPTIREEHSHQKKPSVSRSKTTTATATPQTSTKSERVANIQQVAINPTMTDLVQKSEPVADVEQVSNNPTMIDPIQKSVEVADVEQLNINPTITDPVSNSEQVADIEQVVTHPTMIDYTTTPMKVEDVQQVQIKPTEIDPIKTHIIDGKENTFVYSDGCTHKKAYEACAAKVKDARGDVQRLKDALKAGKLDALGHKKLSGMLKDKPGQLVTTQEDFDDLYSALVNSLAVNAKINAPPGNAAKNRGHPFYNRHALIDSIMRLLQQFPEAGEPQPGMALSAVILCNATHPSGERFRVASTIEDAAFSLVRLTRDDNILAAIDNVADSLLEAHQLHQAQAHTFSLGLRSLSALLTKAATSGKALFDVQERLVVEVASVAIVAFRGECGREILGFVAALKGLIAPEERLVALFEQEDDRNLVMYYLGK